jgi:predicted Zn-dependent peptidase
MLDEGTRSYSARELADRAESMATSLWSNCGWDGSYVGWQCLSPHLEASLDLALEVLLHPTFPEAEWTRVKGQSLAGLQAEADRAESQAYRGLLGAIYPEGHPYRVPTSGVYESVQQLDIKMLADFHARRYGADQAAWIVAGDVDPERVAELLESRVGTWRQTAGTLGEIGGVEVGPRRRILVIHRPGAQQAYLTLGHVGIRRDDGDFYALMLLNQVLGGQFTSRLNAKLREEKGFTYGVRSGFDYRRGAGPFTVSAGIQSDRVAEALSDAVREIEDLLGDRPPTTTEIDDARRALVEGQSRQFETPSALVSRYGGLFLHGRPIDEYQRFAELIGAVGLEELAGAAMRHLHPYSLVAVVVADADEVADPLSRLGWTQIEVVRGDGCK